MYIVLLCCTLGRVPRYCVSSFVSLMFCILFLLKYLYMINLEKNYVVFTNSKSASISWVVEDCFCRNVFCFEACTSPEYSVFSKLFRSLWSRPILRLDPYGTQLFEDKKQFIYVMMSSVKWLCNEFMIVFNHSIMFLWLK